MRKSFTCGAVIAGCPVVFVGVDDDDILRQVVAHAASGHGIESPPPEVAAAVLAAISTVPDYLADAFEGLRAASMVLPVQRSPSEPPVSGATQHSAVEQQRPDLMRRVFQYAPTAVAVTSVDGRFGDVNQALCDLLLIPAAELAGRRLDDLVHADDLAAVRSTRADMVAGRTRRSQLVARLIRTDASVISVELTCAPVLDGPGAEQFIYHLQDVTDRRAEQERLTLAAQTDPLTGLPNRATLFEQLEAALARRARQRGTVALLFCDIDDFKSINDNYGHHVGDGVLTEFARRLTTVSRPTDIAARFAGDEFVLVYQNAFPLDTGALVDRLQRALSRPFLVAGVRVDVSTSIGTAVAVGEDVTAVALLQEADQSMYRVKGAGKAGRQIAASLPPPVEI